MTTPAGTGPTGFDEWLRTTLDLVEGQARAAARGATGRWIYHHPPGVGYGEGLDDWPNDSRDGIVVHSGGAPSREQALHIATWNPAFVLGFIQAAHGILAEHRGETIAYDHRRICRLRDGDYPCRTVRLVAAPFAGWPGWRAEWAA
jgi:hypothetical protein